MRDFLSELVREMRARMSDSGASPYKNMNASGKSRKEFTFDIKTAGGVVTGLLYGPSHVVHLERGRGPGKFPPIKSILQWIEDKGIIPREGNTEANKKSLAFAISKTMAKKGSRIHRKGHRTGILSQTITEEKIGDFFGKVLELKRMDILLEMTERLEEINPG